jgi:peptidoglycan/xylan/chitin deacetylase (PgdA/CDA1 family)
MRRLRLWSQNHHTHGDCKVKMPPFGRLRRTARCLKNNFPPTALILLYHRVVQSLSDPHGLCVTPEHFAEHLEVLRKYGRPMRLQQLIEGLRNGNLPHRAVVLTFDDGYADNLLNAKPLLERHDFPATVFLTTGYLGDKREFWWDELERLVLQARTFPGQLRLNINGRLYQWEYEAADHRPNRWYHRYGSKNVTGGASRHDHLYFSLCNLLRRLPEEKRQKAMDELRVWADVNVGVRISHRPLRPEEVVELAEGELVEMGAHTVTHSVLSALPPAVQRTEIQQSQAFLKELLGCPVRCFAYPHGLQSDYTPETVAIVKAAGFACGCAAFAGPCRQDSDLFQLPRLMVANVHGDEFARRLKNWFQS